MTTARVNTQGGHGQPRVKSRNRSNLYLNIDDDGDDDGDPDGTYDQLWPMVGTTGTPAIATEDVAEASILHIWIVMADWVVWGVKAVAVF